MYEYKTNKQHCSLWQAVISAQQQHCLTLKHLHLLLRERTVWKKFRWRFTWTLLLEFLLILVMESPEELKKSLVLKRKPITRPLQPKGWWKLLWAILKQGLISCYKDFTGIRLWKQLKERSITSCARTEKGERWGTQSRLETKSLPWHAMWIQEGLLRVERSILQ